MSTITKRSICATVVADSKNLFGCRITTFVVTFPRFILAELNTHRVFSRNSASSRARPLKTVLKDVAEDPFVPIKWMAAHKGMQGSEYVDEETSRKAIEKWLEARDAAIKSALELDQLHVTKQLANRLLEPFMWHEAIVTATDYHNFFALRAHKDSEIHFAALAEAMLIAYNASTPRVLKSGEWHVPFDGRFDESKLASLIDQSSSLSAQEQVDTLKIQIACARCARVSYKPFGSEDQYDYAADRKLFQSLVDGGHMSPLEHVARAMSSIEFQRYPRGMCGNFHGFVQYRKTFDNESRIDKRIVGK